MSDTPDTPENLQERLKAVVNTLGRAAVAKHIPLSVNTVERVENGLPVHASTTRLIRLSMPELESMAAKKQGSATPEAPAA